MKPKKKLASALSAISPLNRSSIGSARGVTGSMKGFSELMPTREIGVNVFTACHPKKGMERSN